MLRRELELKAKSLGIRGYSKMPIGNLRDSIELTDATVMDSGLVEVSLVEHSDERRKTEDEKSSDD